VLQNGAMVDVKAVERLKAAQKAAEESNKIAAAKELKFIREQPERPMPWQKQPRFKPLVNADHGYAEDVLNRLAKGGKY
jgi:glutamyl-tRNA reductase